MDRDARLNRLPPSRTGLRDSLPCMHSAWVSRLTSELGYDGFLIADGNEVLDVLR